MHADGDAGEPLDNEIPPETPCLLPKAIKLLLEEGGFTKEQLITTVGLSAQDIETLCYLPNGYLRNDLGDVIAFQSPKLKSNT